MTTGDQPDEPNIASAYSAAADEVSLRILALTDLHMELRGYDYYADRPKAPSGLSRAADIIDHMRITAPNTLLFDNGDILQGNPMGDLAAERYGQGKNVLHPMIAALNTLRLDAATIGNHEFNYGIPFLAAALADANYPVLSANAITTLGASPLEDETLFPPYVILEREVVDGEGETRSLRIGVIGLLPPQIVYWDRKYLSGHVVTRGIVETARAYVPHMKAEGADLIVALSHSGISEVEDNPGLENASLPLAGIDGIDVIVTGHAHQVFPSKSFPGSAGIDPVEGKLHGKPAVMGGVGGSHVGVIDLLLAGRDGGWHITASRATATPVGKNSAPPGLAAQAILAATETAHSETLAHIRRPVGRTNRPLQSYFALLRACDPVRLIAAVQFKALRHSLANTEFADLPLLSAAAPFKAGGRGGGQNYTDIPAGGITIGNVADLYGFPNILKALLINGAALRNWLEFSAGIFQQIEPNRADQPLRDEDFPSYNFDSIFGVTYRIDLTGPPRFDATGTMRRSGAGRIRDLSWCGRPVDDTQTFVVATNDYRASRSGAFPGADEGREVPVAPVGHRDLLIHYLQGTPPHRPLPPPPWNFAPIDGASALIETGWGAEAYVDEAESLGLVRVAGSVDRLRFRRAF